MQNKGCVRSVYFKGLFIKVLIWRSLFEFVIIIHLWKYSLILPCKTTVKALTQRLILGEGGFRSTPITVGVCPTPQPAAPTPRPEPQVQYAFTNQSVNHTFFFSHRFGFMALKSATFMH
jgi:hypothetical protein